MILELMLVGMGMQMHKIDRLHEEIGALKVGTPLPPKLGFWAQCKADRIKEDADREAALALKKAEEAIILRNHMAGFVASHSARLAKASTEPFTGTMKRLPIDLTARV